MRRPLIVFVGGGIGSSLRDAMLFWLGPWNGGIPLPVILVNAVGSFVLGIVFVLANEAELLRGEMRLFLAVGVLGGFTTFSTLGWSADILLASPATRGDALVYLAVSFLAGVTAVWAGLSAGRELAHMIERATRPISGRMCANGQRKISHVDEDMATVEAEDRKEPA